MNHPNQKVINTIEGTKNKQDDIKNVITANLLNSNACTKCRIIQRDEVYGAESARNASYTTDNGKYGLRSFGEPCKFVMQRLRCQILKWTSCDDCGHRSNKCLYSLKEPKSQENNTIRATHLSPNLQLVDDIKIEFDETLNDSCVAMAKSVSRSWFMVFDYGTNYCNLRNLVEGVGLYMERGFDESTNDTVCTQRSTALCT